MIYVASGSLTSCLIKVISLDSRPGTAKLLAREFPWSRVLSLAKQPVERTFLYLPDSKVYKEITQSYPSVVFNIIFLGEPIDQGDDGFVLTPVRRLKFHPALQKPPVIANAHL